MFKYNQFKEVIVRPVLDDLQMYSENAETLLMFTAGAESLGGTYLTQVKGPALGVFQCEPDTHYDIWFNFIKYRSGLMNIMALKFAVNNIPEAFRLVYDLRYAAAIARIHYLRVKEPLPNKDNIEAVYEYYKKYYNTVKGKSSQSKAIANYESFLKNA